MISVSTNPIPFTITRDAFDKNFESIDFVKPLFLGKNTQPLPSKDTIKFLLKRVAILELRLDKEKGENWIQWVSTKEMNFQTALRFEWVESNQICIHIETDTNVFMELFLERRIKKLISTIADNISKLHLS